ncbi:hypothetical protein R3P38DRAFT_2541833 [Favolaschia claudopus]|uniref:Uncharacterized protein n=1 Tax=Favolaschia claudopus TaxID=2862362 RepID=A0AAW0ATC7_9AGAR
MKDLVFDASNPNPTIDRAASTRRNSNKDSGESRALQASKPPPGSSKSARPAPSAPSASKGVVTKPSTALVSKDSQPPAAPSRPSSTASLVNSPTTASAARSVLAPPPRPPAFGSAEPRMPSHMKETGRRGPAPINLNIESDSPTSFENVSTPVDETAHSRSSAQGSVDRSNRSSTRSSRSRSSGAISYAPPTPSGKGDGKSESITAALARRHPEPTEVEMEYPRLLQGPGKTIDIYEEPLEASVRRYHGSWDLSDGTEDPLAIFGAEGGELPGIDPARTLALRDAVIRYAKKHRSFEDELPGTIVTVLKIDAGAVGLRTLEEEETQKRIYSLGLEELAKAAHAVLAVQQILEALTVFLQKDPKRSFTLDLGFGFLRLMERSEQAAEVRFALSTIQRRLHGANTHIMKYFYGIRETLTGDAPSEQLSSVDSTITEVREEFGTQHPSKELRRLMMRPDYYKDAGIIDKEARTAMILELQEVPRKKYFNTKDAQGIPTIKENDNPGSSAVPTAAVPLPGTPGVFGVRFAPPVSPHPKVSAARAW